MDRFDKKIALITGGASGIGAATARRLAEEGATIIIADLNEKAGEELARDLGGDSAFIPLNVADESSWAAISEKTAAQFGRLDMLVHCAGVTGFGNIESTTLDGWRKAMDVNGIGTLLACRHGVERMRETGGAIVVVASFLSMRASADQLTYSASKAATLQIARATALHCAKKQYPIRCNSVLPGGVDTPLMEEVEDLVGGRDQLENAMAASHPMRRMGRPEEIAAAIAFLLSDDASYMTAAGVAVDGGRMEV